MNVNQKTHFKIAYGTYGMPKEDPKVAIPRLSEMGYEGLEICVGEAYPTAPQRLSKTERAELRSIISELLPGEGDFNYVAYFQAMTKAGWSGCITVEISGMIFSKPDYDPWPAAGFSWKTLSTARGEAQV